MIIAKPETIARVLMLLQGDPALDEPRLASDGPGRGTPVAYKPGEVPQRIPRHVVRLADAQNIPRGVLLSCLDMTRGGAFVCMVAHVAEQLAASKTQSGQAALDLAKATIEREWMLTAGEPKVNPSAASAVALLALKVNGRWSLETFAELGEAWPSSVKEP